MPWPDLELPDVMASRVINYRKLRWASHVVKMEDSWNIFKMLIGKSGNKRTSRKILLGWTLQK